MLSFSEAAQDTNKSINFKGKTIKLDQPIIMGILNVTPDSFFDGGKRSDIDQLVAHVKQLLNEGASIIDVGGYSTRPGAKQVSEKEELDRVLPPIKALVKAFPQIVISIDTFRSQVAKKCIEVGASIVNDVTGGAKDEKLFDTIAQLNVPYVLTHLQGDLETMQQNPTYNNVVDDVTLYFKEKIAFLTTKGVHNIILDPGFGFGKTIQHNYELLNNINILKSFGLPILVGISRKSMINKPLNITPQESLNGTTVLNTVALMKGANILRVHDVKEAKEVIELVGQF